MMAKPINLIKIRFSDTTVGMKSIYNINKMMSQNSVKRFGNVCCFFIQSPVIN